jgi:phosphatidylinositol-3-phosphatase
MKIKAIVQMLTCADITKWIRKAVRPQTATLGCHRALFAAAAVGVVLAAQTAPAQTVSNIFVIAMENHNFTQPASVKKPQPILGNPAAPFINSLITPGNPNAAQVSFATAYYNAGAGVHPSEPNYVWAEAGSDFGVHSDADPSPANGNTFYDQSNHVTAQLNAAGIPWKNYQEDVEFSASPTNSASGTASSANPFNGSTEIGYAVKHNPMAFFADTDIENVFPLEQLFADLTNGTVGRYNWITPNLFNDAHSALKGGFRYLGSHFSGDQAAIAQGDNFLSIVVPQIMASPAYQNNGVIVIWWDETEGGDDTNFTLPEIVISPLAKGNAYASTVPMSHSSDIKTWDEVFGVGLLDNPIPAAETNNFGGFNSVPTANDLSDLFLPGVIPGIGN